MASARGTRRLRTYGLSADGWSDRRPRRVRGGFAPRHNATLLLRSLRDRVPRLTAAGDEWEIHVAPLTRHSRRGRRTLYELTRAKHGAKRLAKTLVSPQPPAFQLSRLILRPDLTLRAFDLKLYRISSSRKLSLHHYNILEVCSSFSRLSPRARLTLAQLSK